MPLRKAQPIRFSAKGLSDAYDSTDAFEGACRSLQNLVFDPSNPEIVSCRPGVVALTSFGSFNTPTFVTGYISIGSVIYGMVSTGLTPGYDQPFAYDVLATTFISISGITSGNVPLSPPTTGAWTPPSFTVVGTKIIVTHTGFSGTGSNFFGVIDISTPSTPAWSTHNLATNALPSRPTSVANLNNRAYFACGNVDYYTDVLDPLTRTNASQSLTLGDTSPITAQSGLPVQTTSAGVVQALLVFKEFQIWQITGDSATSNLSLNYLSLNVGTKSPRSVAQTPYGTNFAAIDGPYIVDPLGAVRPLTKQIGDIEQDIQAPFIYATQPTRIAGGYSGGLYRLCIDTFLSGVAVTGDYWFDIQRRRWNGPHTFPYDCAAQIGNYFIISHASKGAVLYKSQLVQDTNSVFTDAGTPIAFNMESSTFPKDPMMAEKQVVESNIELSTAGASVSYSISAIDDQRTNLSSVVQVIPASGYVWGSFMWGAGQWSSAVNVPHTYTIAWTQPLVFQKMALIVSGTASSNIAIGSFRARYQFTGYSNQ